jgi:undecaprenyl diphosphate synthase
MQKSNSSVPAHIAIIMDGNRRWARAHGLPLLSGHRKVADEILEPLVEHAAKRGISFITFWAFSTENWQRDKGEVAGIMRIFRHVVKKRWQRLHAQGVRVQVIGDIAKFPSDLRDSLEKVVAQTKDNKKITAVFALNYGGRDEIVRAMHGLKSPGTVTKEEFSSRLDTAGMPDPDLIVRTGGEMRLSGFLLWQSEYAELSFPTFSMPEFTPARLDEILDEYASRKRRFGK